MPQGLAEAAEADSQPAAAAVLCLHFRFQGSGVQGLGFMSPAVVSDPWTRALNQAWRVASLLQKV